MRRARRCSSSASRAPATSSRTAPTRSVHLSTDRGRDHLALARLHAAAAAERLPASRWTQDLLRKSSEPPVDVGDTDGGGVADGELVVAGGECTLVFEGVDAALDGVPVAIDHGVEAGWSSAGGTTGLAVGGLVGGGRDGGLDATAT